MLRKLLPLLEEMKRRTPAGLVALTAIPGIGPKRAKLLFDELKICSVADLKKAASAGKPHGIAGFGTKTELKLADELKHKREPTSGSGSTLRRISPSRC